jgi:antitoxin (DNA-binding transcriptional repressor) of toxin-antitoxin stability system
MTNTVNIPETADQFALLLNRIHAGEEFLLSQDEVLIARVVPIQKPTQPRIPGQDQGKVVISSDFNDPLPDNILLDFLNSDIPAFGTRIYQPKT